MVSSPDCATLAPWAGHRVMLPATVVAITPVPRRDGSGMLTQIRLADATGQANLLLDAALSHRLDELHRHQCILAELCVHSYDWGVGGQLLDWWDVPSGQNFARLLPLGECPDGASESLQRLITIVENLQVPAVTKAFNTLVQKAGTGLLEARASWHDHHAQPGGLLIHTVEVIEFVRRETAWVFPNDPARLDLICLMALAHDLAKSQLHRTSGANAFSQGLGHQLASVAIVSEALQQLGRDEPRLGQLAGQILRWLSLPVAARRIRQCPEAELVQRADEFSVIAHITNRAPLPYQRLALPA